MPTEDDADLADLLGTEKKPLRNGNSHTHNTHNYPSPGLCAFLSAYLSYLCFAYPKCCGVFSCLAAFLVVLTLVASVVNPTQSFGVVSHDWTTVNSVYELDVAKIDHWCLGGGNDGCRCEDPLVPTSRSELRSWTEAYKDNRRMIDKYMDDELILADLDVAIVGESAVEEMDGRWLGRFRDDELKSIGTIFRNHFNRDHGADVEGVALGIAGDSASNVLWRLIHGEMPDGFEPKIWWVHLGANDLTRQQCSEEVVVLGILRVVEEILNKRPNARIVINSLLPMADLRGGTVVTEKDYRDAFSTYRGKRAIHYVRKTNNGVEKFVKKQSSESKSSKSSNSADRHARRLLEAALESYSTRHNDNSEEIERYQRKLQLDILSLDNNPEASTEILNDNHNSHRPIQRRLEDDIPKGMRKDKYNPTLDTQHHEQKKYAFFREQRKPLWTSIYAINKQLWKFCEKHDRVDFFDATNIFSHRQGDIGQKYFTLLSDKISARGHPTQQGYLEWEDAMVVMIKKIIAEMKEEQPELFLTPADPGTYQGGTTPAEVGRVETKSYETYDRDGAGNGPATDDGWGDENDDQTGQGGYGQPQGGADEYSQSQPEGTGPANDDGWGNENDDQTVGDGQQQETASYSQSPMGQGAGSQVDSVQSYGQALGNSTHSQQTLQDMGEGGEDDAGTENDDSTGGAMLAGGARDDDAGGEDDQVAVDTDDDTTPGGVDQGGADDQAGGDANDNGLDQNADTDDAAAPGGDRDQGTDDQVGVADVGDETTGTDDTVAKDDDQGGTDDEVGGGIAGDAGDNEATDNNDFAGNDNENAPDDTETNEAGGVQEEEMDSDDEVE